MVAAAPRRIKLMSVSLAPFVSLSGAVAIPYTEPHFKRLA